MSEEKVKRYKRSGSIFLSPKKEYEGECSIVNVASELERLDSGKKSWVFEGSALETEESWLKLREEYLSGKYWTRVSSGSSEGSGNRDFKTKSRSSAPAQRTGVRR